MLAISMTKCWPFSWLARSHTARPPIHTNTTQQNRRRRRQKENGRNIIYFNLLIAERPLLFDSLADIRHEWIHWPICAEWQVICRISHFYCGVVGSCRDRHICNNNNRITWIVMFIIIRFILFTKFLPNVCRSQRDNHPILSPFIRGKSFSKTLRGRLIQLFVRA